jgi:hypothetical protein
VTQATQEDCPRGKVTVSGKIDGDRENSADLAPTRGPRWLARFEVVSLVAVFKALAGPLVRRHDRSNEKLLTHHRRKGCAATEG